MFRHCPGTHRAKHWARGDAGQTNNDAKKQIINVLTLGGHTMSDRTQIAERNQSRVQENSRTDASTEVVIDKLVIRSVAAFSGLVGLWALACLGSAMFQAGAVSYTHLRAHETDSYL